MGDYMENDLRGWLYRLIDYIDYYNRIGSLPDCNTCGKQKDCEYVPAPGDFTRINCPHWEANAN